MVLQEAQRGVASLALPHSRRKALVGRPGRALVRDIRDLSFGRGRSAVLAGPDRARRWRWAVWLRGRVRGVGSRVEAGRLR